MPVLRIEGKLVTFAANPTEADIDEVGAKIRAETGPSLMRRGAAMAAEVGIGLAGGVAGFATPIPGGTAAGLAIGGTLGSLASQKILGQETDIPMALTSGALNVLPATRAGKYAIKAGIPLVKRAAAFATEGAIQGALSGVAQEAVHAVRAGEAPGVVEAGKRIAASAGIGSLTGTAFGGALHVATGGGAAARAAGDAVEAKAVEFQTLLKEAEVEPSDLAQADLFVKRASPEAPKTMPAPKDRVEKIATETLDRQFDGLPDDARDVLRTIVRDNAAAIVEHTRGTQTIARTRHLSEDILPDIERHLPKGSTLNAEQGHAVGSVMGALVLKGQKLGRQIDAAKIAGEDTAPLLAEFAQNRGYTTNMLLTLRGASTEAGRFLRMQRESFNATRSPEMKALRAAKKAGISDEAMASLMARADSPETLYRLARDSQKRGFGVYARWYMFTSLLSGPRTQARNALSNTANIVIKPAVTKVASMINPGAVAPGEASRQVVGAYRALSGGLAWRRAKYFWDNGFTMRDVGDFELSTMEIPGGKLTNFVTRALGFTDEFTRAMAAQMEGEGLAWQRGLNDAKRAKLTGKAAKEHATSFAASLIANPDNELVTMMDRAGAHGAFQEKAGKLTQGLMDVREALGPLGLVTMPFIKTTMNVLGQGVEFTPGGFKIAAGKGGREKAMTNARAAIGSAMMFPLAALYADGRIIGAAPRDPKERAQFYDEKKTPNSVNIGGRYVPFQSLGPLSVPLGIVAAVGDAVTGGKDDKTVEELLIHAASGAANVLLQSTVMTGISSLADAIADPERHGSAYLKNLGRMAVPLGGAVKEVQTWTDPTVRSPDTLAEAFSASVPGLDQSVMPRIDAFGETIKRPQAFFPKVEEPEKFRAELHRLGVHLQPDAEIKSIAYKGHTWKFSPEEDLAYRRARGQRKKKYLVRVMQQPAFEKLSAEAKVKTIKEVIRKSNAEVKEAALITKIRGGTLE